MLQTVTTDCNIDLQNRIELDYESSWAIDVLKYQIVTDCNIDLESSVDFDCESRQYKWIEYEYETVSLCKAYSTTRWKIRYGCEVILL